MPSRKIVLREERGNRPQLEKQESAQKNLFILETISGWYIWVRTLLFQTASSLHYCWLRQAAVLQPHHGQGTRLQLKGWPLTWKHLCSPSLAKDRERALPKSLHSPECTVCSIQSSHCCIPTLLRRLKQSRQGMCVALSERSKETSLEYLD